MSIVSRLAVVALATVVGLMPAVATAQPQRPWIPRGGNTQFHRPPTGPGFHRPPTGPGFHRPPPGPGFHRPPPGRWHDGRWHRHYRTRYYDRDYGWYPGAVVGGVIVGSAIAGAMTSGDVHVDRCLRRYRSYDPRTDTYLGYDGHRHYCRL